MRVLLAGGGTAGHINPALAIAKTIKEKDKTKVIVIGDSLSSDIKGAQNAELDYIWYNHNKLPVPQELSAVAIVNDIKEIDAIL